VHVTRGRFTLINGFELPESQLTNLSGASAYNWTLETGKQQ